MMRVVEALAGFAYVGPAVFDARQSVLIEGGGTLGEFASPENARMIRCDGHECRYRRGEPPWREVMPSERGPHHDHHEKTQKQPDVSQTYVNFFVVRNPRFAGLQALRVFFRGRHWLKM